jgi:hypothetical protein
VHADPGVRYARRDSLTRHDNKPEIQTMNDTTIILRPHHMKAALLFAPKKDIRWYLIGVHVRVRPFGETILSATCGAAMARIRSHQDKDAAPVDVDMILPRAFAETIAKSRDYFVTLTIGTPTDELKRVYPVVAPACGAVCQSLDYKYPDLGPVFPTSASGEVAQFDADILARFSDARRVLASSKSGRFYLAHNGQNAAAVCIGQPDTFAGCVMPFRADADADAIDFCALPWAKQG